MISRCNIGIYSNIYKHKYFSFKISIRFQYHNCCIPDLQLVVKMKTRYLPLNCGNVFDLNLVFEQSGKKIGRFIGLVKQGKDRSEKLKHALLELEKFNTRFRLVSKIGELGLACYSKSSARQKEGSGASSIFANPDTFYNNERYHSQISDVKL